MADYPKTAARTDAGQPRSLADIREWLVDPMLKGATGVMTPVADLRMLLEAAEGAESYLTPADVIAHCRSGSQQSEAVEARAKAEMKARSDPDKTYQMWKAIRLAEAAKKRVYDEIAAMLEKGQKPDG